MAIAGGRSRATGRTTLSRAAVAAVLVVAALSIGGESPARGDGECRITGGYGSVSHSLPANSETWLYQGAIFLYTADCGIGVKEVYGSFRPVDGTPAGCDPRPSHQIDIAACTFAGSIGIGQPGTPVEVSATALIAGAVKVERPEDAPPTAEADPGTDQSESTCMLSLPEEGSRRGCVLFAAP